MNDYLSPLNFLRFLLLLAHVAGPRKTPGWIGLVSENVSAKKRAYCK